MLPPIKNVECLYCHVGLLPFSTCPILSQRSYHYTILWVSYMFIHSCIYSMHTNIIHAWLHYQSYFNCTKCVIQNVSKSEMLPIMYISSGRSHQNSRLPMPFHFPSVSPSVVVTPLRWLTVFPFVCWSLPHWGDWRYFLSYVDRYPIEVIDGISFRMLVVTPLRWLTVIPFVCWSLPHWGNWRYFLSYVGRYPSKDNWRYFLSCVGHYPNKDNWRYPCHTSVVTQWR